MNCSGFHNDFLGNKTLNIFHRNVYFAGISQTRVFFHYYQSARQSFFFSKKSQEEKEKKNTCEIIIELKQRSMLNVLLRMVCVYF